MSLRSILCVLVLGCALAGCAHHEDKPEKEKAKTKEAAKAKKPSIPDASGDTSFQSFLGRLRIAVHTKDKPMIQSMMSPDFGWRWDTPPAGETPFDYWDQNQTWGELETLLNDQFGPSENYMVSPPAFRNDSHYRGYRCGLRQFNGAWRFAYFITGEDVLQ
jgi:hypothetical protein